MERFTALDGDRPEDKAAVRDLGVQAPVGPGTGGVLDLITAQPGRYPITLALSGRRVGELRVRG